MSYLCPICCPIGYPIEYNPMCAVQSRVTKLGRSTPGAGMRQGIGKWNARVVVVVASAGRAAAALWNAIKDFTVW